MIRHIFLFTISVVAIIASPVPADKEQDCLAILKSAGASERFPGAVAHGIHSITLEDLEKFNPNVTEHNLVPTVNLDLSSDIPIFFHAPSQKLGGMFKTDGMKAVDQVLSHMDNKKYDVKQYTALERLVHALHMQEVWHEAQQEYQKVKANPPNAQVCKCATDIENNGITKMLRLIALELREPELMYGKHTPINNGEASWDSNVYKYSFPDRNAPQAPKSDKLIPSIPLNNGEASWSGNVYNYGFPDRKAPEVPKKSDKLIPSIPLNNGEASWSGNVYNYGFPDRKADPAAAPKPQKSDKLIQSIPLNNGEASWDSNVYKYSFPERKSDDVLRQPDDVMPQLTNEAAWKHWKELMMTMEPKDNYELALYLYCALNQ